MGTIVSSAGGKTNSVLSPCQNLSLPTTDNAWLLTQVIKYLFDRISIYFMEICVFVKESSALWLQMLALRQVWHWSSLPTNPITSFNLAVQLDSRSINI